MLIILSFWFELTIENKAFSIRVYFPMLKALFLFILFVIFSSQLIAKDQCVENIINANPITKVKVLVLK